MAGDRHIVFYHIPNSRSSGTFALLEELKADYELKVLNMKAGEQRQPAYLAINPMGKVPAITHNGTLITEQGAIFIYLADLYADRGLAPALTDPLRGPYLRWLVYYGSSFEPAVVDKAQKHAPGPQRTIPYGDYDTMMGILVQQLAKGPYLLGEQFTAADVLWGGALTWTTSFGLVNKTPEIQRYIDRINARPVSAKIKAMDADFAAKQAARS